MTIWLWEGSLEVPMSEGIVYVFPFTASADQEIMVSAVSSQRDLDADPLGPDSGSGWHAADSE